MKHSTQYARTVRSDEVLKYHFKSRFPAFNVHRRHEAVATDTVFSNTPAIDNGATCAQIFVGRNSLFADVYGMKSDAEFAKALEDVIRRRGAMDLLISDKAQAEISDLVTNLLRAYVIDSWQSEPEHQNQNYFERCYQTIKTYVNRIMDRTGSPPELWLLCLQYVCYVLNRLSVPSLKYDTPIHKATGKWGDISALLHYHFYKPVYYKVRKKPQFPSESTERKGYWVGVAEHVGDELTYLVLTADTWKVIPHSKIRSAVLLDKRNL